MPRAWVSNKGQVTLPSDVRRRMGIEPASHVDIGIRGDEVVIRRARTLGEMYDVLHQYAKDPAPSREAEREAAERAAAEEALRA